MKEFPCSAAIGALLLISGSTGGAFALSGAIYTTDKTGTIVNGNTNFGFDRDVYLSGGPQNLTAGGLADGTYYFQVTDPSGKTLLSTDPASCRQLTVTGGRVVAAVGTPSSCNHAPGMFNPANGATPVQLIPFSPTPNKGTVYKAWVIPVGKATISGFDDKVLIFAQANSKTDNFKIPVNPLPVGSCQPSSSVSVLVQGVSPTGTVLAYVPKGAWQTGATGVSVVNVEGALVAPTLIPTGSDVVNSCASNQTTTTTVCTANNAHVYLTATPSLIAFATPITSGGGPGEIQFSGGFCINCGVAMDAVHNKALIGLSIGGTTPGFPPTGTPGFQFLNLAGIPAFEPTIVSPSGMISEDPLIDPLHNSVGTAGGSLLLSAAENNTYEIADVAITTSPLFFEHPIPFAGGSAGEADSSGEDCSTQIALAPAENFATIPSGLSQVFIADITTATFTPGVLPAPGTWTAPSAVATLTESILSAGASGLAVAQGTHTGIVSGEFSPAFGSNAITAIALPTTSGGGATPALIDWVTCTIPDIAPGTPFNNGLDPHTVTAYQSPNILTAGVGDAIAVLANGGATTLAVVDLTKMLDTTIVPRTSGVGLGHACTTSPLPASVVSFVSVP